MLTPNYLKALPDSIVGYFYELEDFIIGDIARRIKKVGTATSTAELQRIVAQSIAEGSEAVNEKIGEVLGISKEEVSRLFKESEQVAQENQTEISERLGIPIDKGFSEKIALAAINTAQGQLENLTRTAGFLSQNGQFTLLSDAYRHALGSETIKAATGAVDYNSAIRRVLRQFTDSGLCVEFESGVHRSLEASIRQNIISGVKDMAADIMQKNAETLGTDGWEVSAHLDCAPDHEGVQGRQFTNEEYERLNNSLKRPIGTLNCRHTAYPILMGISEPVYSKSELREMAAKNAEGITYEGKHYTLYEADQMQRRIERSIRKCKRQIISADEAGLEDFFTEKSIRLRRLRDYYVDFSGKAGLNTRSELLQVGGYGRSLSRKVLAAEKDYYKKQLEQIQKGTFDATENGKYKELKSQSEFMQLAKTQNITAEEGKILWDKDYGYIQNSTGYKVINNSMRNGEKVSDGYQRTIDTLKKVTSRNSLDDNYLGVRYVDPAYLNDVVGVDVTGRGWGFVRSSAKQAEQVTEIINNSKVGTMLTDKAVTSISMVKHLNYFKDRRSVEFIIQMPKGTKGLVTDNRQETEFMAKPESALEIIGAEVYNYVNDSGQFRPRVCIYVKLIN